MKKYIYLLLIGVFVLFAFKAEDYFEISKNLDIFAEVYKEVNTTYVDEVKPGELIRAAIDGMLKSLDPYTNFYSEAQAEDYRYQVTGTYAGIGSTIRTIDDYVHIESPVEGFPAHKAGLLPGDKILAVDGEDMKGKKSSEVTEYLKGKAGTSFELTIERMGEGELTKSITREKIKIKNVPYQGIIEDEIGYIKLTGFTPNAGKEVRDAVIDLKGKGAKKLLEKEIDGVCFNGDTSQQGGLYTVLNVSLPPHDNASTLLFQLDMNGICASGGSACNSGAIGSSHVLEGIGHPTNRSAVRFSFSKFTTRKEVDYAVGKLKELFR